MRRIVSLTVASAFAVLSHAPAAHADLGALYGLVGSFALPGGAFDLLPDGRLLSVDALGTVSVQTAPNASTFTPVGSIGAVNSSGFAPSFIALSPSGQTLAVGNNEFSAASAVLFFDAPAALSGSATPTSSIATPGFTGVWADDGSLYVSGAESSTFATVVNRLDPVAGSSTTVIAPAGGFSGAVAAANGFLYAGAGDTGSVYAFGLPSLAAAVSPVAIDSGEFIATHASAGSIDFDPFGNIIIAGGFFEFSSGLFSGSAAVIDPVTQERLVLTPAGENAFYGSYFNHATNQLVVTADGTAYVYNVPAPATALALGLLALPRRSRKSRA